MTRPFIRVGIDQKLLDIFGKTLTLDASLSGGGVRDVRGYRELTLRYETRDRARIEREYKSIRAFLAEHNFLEVESFGNLRVCPDARRDRETYSTLILFGDFTGYVAFS
jgi:hypothetical protein